MLIKALMSEPAVLARITWKFIPWYFIEVPWKMAERCIAYVRAFGDIFSFFFLLKTFFSPWKSIVDAYPEKGFQLELILQAFFLNMTSRIIGMIFRTVAFVMGLIIEVAVIALFLSILFVWFFFPVILVFDLMYLFGS